MKDIRIYENMARELISRNSQLTFRMLLKNDNVIDRVLKPIKSIHSSDEILYSREYVKYTKKNKNSNRIIDPMNIDTSQFFKESSIESPLSTKNGVVIEFVSFLLKSGYELYEESKVM